MALPERSAAAPSRRRYAWIGPPYAPHSRIPRRLQLFDKPCARRQHDRRPPTESDPQTSAFSFGVSQDETTSLSSCPTYPKTDSTHPSVHRQLPTGWYDARHPCTGADAEHRSHDCPTAINTA